ncbi:MAG: hypothetical protein IGS03_12795 [Candidatus Sericytochromatia bacterium]|nr:hypothetical protein [Candidatus Sericytochromatia bacterium]
MAILEQAILPLSLMPGLGLMIMSTVNLSVHLSQELHILLQQSAMDPFVVRQKIQQLKRLNQSLFCLYASAGSFLLVAFSSLFKSASGLMQWGVGFGVLTWLIALVLLIIFASRAIAIKQYQFQSRLQDGNTEA